LIKNYQEQLLTYNESIQAYAFETLKIDTEKYSPLKEIREDKDGEMLSTKKDIYRFSDRTVVGLRNSLENVNESNWSIKNLAISSDGQKNRLCCKYLK